MKPSRTIFITSFHPLISRNIISTDIPSALVDRGFQVVVLVPDFKADYFRKTFASAGIVIEGVLTGAAVRTKRVGLFKRLAEALPDTRRAELGRRLTLDGRRKSFIYYYCLYYPAHFLGKSYFLMRVIRFLDYLISPRGRFFGLLKKYRPVLVFSTDVQNENDVSLMQDARRLGVMTVGMVRSWDNLVLRAFRFVPPCLIVASELLRQQAVKLYGLNPNAITVSGVPHYDRYLREMKSLDGKGFLEKVGLDPAKPTVLFFPLCDYRVVWASNGERRFVDREVLEVLAGMSDLNVIVRFPPNETVSVGGFAPAKNFFCDRPGVAFGGERVTTREVSKEDDDRLMYELSAADVCVTGPSTAVIDAALFDKPIVFVDFSSGNAAGASRRASSGADREGFRDRPGQAFEYQSEHIADVLKTGGTRSARDTEELRRFIREAVADPARNREGRRRIVAEQCFQTDARASHRVVEVLSLAAA